MEKNCIFLPECATIHGGMDIINALMRGMIVAGASEEAIRARWVPDVERYREKRVQYLLYE